MTYLIVLFGLFFLSDIALTAVMRSLPDEVSDSTIFGIPLYNASQVPPRGWFNVGVMANGIGAAGVVAHGALAIGLVSFGGLGIGVIALGGGAVGVIAIGGGACGLVAIGGGALGFVAIGGGARGVYVFAGKGYGRHVFDGQTEDEEAARFFARFVPGLKRAFTP